MRAKSEGTLSMSPSLYKLIGYFHSSNTQIPCPTDTVSPLIDTPISVVRCNRSKPHEATLKSLLGVLSNVCRYSELLPAVFRAGDCIETLSEKLQMFRDTEVRDSH